MQWVERGVLAVEDTVSRFVPDYPNGERITLHHLLSNTSGIPDYILMPSFPTVAKRRLKTDELIALFRDAPLLFEPGERFAYSNSNWVLLGKVLEQMTGKPYGEAIREQIFEPAGMATAGYTWETPLIPHRAQGYVDSGNGIINAEFIDETALHGAGGLYATVDDLLRFDRALAAGKIVRSDTLERMAANGTAPYGYGWELESIHGRRVVGHSGGMPGYMSNFARFVDDDVTVSVLSNLGSAEVKALTEALGAIVFGLPYEKPSARRFIEIDPAQLKQYEGDYSLTYFGRTSVLSFRVENGQLMMHVPGLPSSIVRAMSETTFFARSKGEVEMTFLRDQNGDIKGIDVNWSGHRQFAPRI